MAAVSFKERQRHAREEAILAAAEEALAAQGPVALSMEAIAARAGVGIGTIYLHFAGKDALLAAVLARGLTAANAFIAALDPSSPALSRLRKVLEMLMERRPTGIQFVGDEFQEMKRVMVADARCAALIRDLRLALEALIDEGKRADELDPRAPAPVAVDALFALLSPRTHGQLRAATDMPAAAVNAALIRLYLRGIARDPTLID